MTVIIRTATAKDAEAIALLSRETFYETFARYNTEEDMDKFMHEQFSKELLMAEVGTDENIFLAAFAENELLGYTKMKESKNPPALGNAKAIEIARIYTSQKTIGKGIGKALMQKAIDTAKELQKEIIWLGVWEHNAHAIEFYKKWGFEKFAEHDFVLGNDVQTDWLMKKIF